MIYALFSIIYTTDNAYTDVQSKNTLSYTCMLHAVTYQWSLIWSKTFGPKHKSDYASPFPFWLTCKKCLLSHDFPLLPCTAFPISTAIPLLLHCPPPLPFCRVPGAPSCKGISTSWWVTADVPLPHSRCGDPAVTWITTNRAQLTSLAERKEEFVSNNV